MKKVFHLSTCNTSQRIIKELGGLPGFEHQDVKVKHISAKELDFLKNKAGSYEALFNRRSKKYRQLGLNEMKLSEKDYRKYILQEYSLLKRPIIVDGEKVFIGNSKKTVTSAKAHLSQ
ncbi:MAG TPA: hypothetical protein ENJ20_05295 [Bacteroidetes bacterium]|nr:hypothetical protein [Bacteroidota bacterium]